MNNLILNNMALESLKLFRCYFDETVFSYISTLHNLKSLEFNVDSRPFTPDWQLLKRLQHIQSLEILVQPGESTNFSIDFLNN